MRGVHRWIVPALTLLLVTGARADELELYTDDFEAGDALSNWSLTGDWRLKTNSACLPSDLGYISPVTALVFDFGQECAYRNNRSGFATMTQDIAIPITLPSVSLEWSDFAAAELGSDFYFIQVSTDGGATWPTEVLRDSVDETFWDEESVDLSQFIGESIRLRFGFISDATITNLGWYIDDLRIVGETLDEGVSAVAISDASVVEGDSGVSTMSFQLDISPVNDDPIQLEYATANGSALAGLDYAASSSPLTIPAGASTHQIDIFVLGDAFFEQPEDFQVLISNASANAHITIAEASGTIIDDDELTCLYEENFETPEGTFPWTTGYLPGQLPADPDCTPDPTGAGCDVQLWHIQAASACIPTQSGGGFTSPTRALVFNREADCMYDTLGGVEGIAAMTSGIDIPGVDALTAQLSFNHFLEIANNAIQAEVTTAYVEISTNAGINWDILRTFAPPAPSGEHYVIPWQEEVITLNDYIGEDVFIRFRFKQPNEVNPNDARGWFIDDFKICIAARPDGVSKVTIDPSSALEGNAGTSPLTFPITIEPTNTSPILLSFETAEIDDPDAATADTDFVSTMAPISIPANSTTSSLNVSLIGDDEPEAAFEYFNLALTSVSPNVFLVNEEILATIEDDDTPSTFTVGVVSSGATQVDETAGQVTFEVEISQSRSVPIALNYTTQNDTALGGPGLDYLPASGTLFFPANTLSNTFAVTILDDTQEDPGELFNIVLSTDSAYATGGTTAIEIVDDETGPAAGASLLSIDDEVITEGSCPTISAPDSCAVLYTVTFTIELATANAGPISVDYATEDGEASAGIDYVPVAGTAAIPAFDTETTVDVDIWADRRVEGDETFRLVLSNPQGNVNVVSNTGTATIRDDDFDGRAFGVNGGDIFFRDLDEAVSDTTIFTGIPVDLTAADFKAFEFDKLYGWDNNVLKTVSLVAGTAANLGTVDHAALIGGGESWSGIAWDHTNGEMIASSTEGHVARLDIADGTVLSNDLLGQRWVAVAVHPTTGRIYGVARTGATGAELYRIDRGTPMTETLIGTLAGISAGNAAQDAFWDCDFDDVSGELLLNAYVTGDIWVTHSVSLTPGSTPLSLDTRIELENPDVSAIAIATSPTPPSVQWTSDLVYESNEPTGVQLAADTTALAGADAGRVVTGVGDVNGDTFEDFLVAAPRADVMDGANTRSEAGRVFVVFGGIDVGLADLIGQLDDAEADFDEDLPDGVAGIVITGATSGERIGLSATGLGDMNGDYIADFALGFDDASGAGGALLIYGSMTLPPLFSTSTVGDLNAGAEVRGVRIVGADEGDGAGISIAGAGDFNGSGFKDLIIGAPDAGPDATPGTGAAYLIFGSDSGIGSSGAIDLQSLMPPRGIRIIGESTGDAFGTSVSGIGDLNGDGVDDVAIGAPGANTGDGSVLALFGHVDYQESNAPNPLNLARLGDANPGAGIPDSILLTVVMPGKGDLAELVNPDILLPPYQPGDLGKLPGMRISGETGSALGTAVAGVGDFNGDSVSEMIIGAPNHDGSAADEAHWGRSYLIFGDVGEAHAPESDAADVSTDVPGVIITGIDEADGTGTALAGAGDVNGDGLMDVLIGAAGATPGGFSGEAYLLLGSNGLQGTLSLRDLADPDPQSALGQYLYNTAGGTGFEFGATVASSGDFNNDSISDYLVGRDGGAYVLLGSTAQSAATYKNRIRSGVGALGDLPGGTGIDLGDTVRGEVGGATGGAFSRPASRVGIEFTGGGFGSEFAEASMQSVTLFRSAAPDVPVGSGAADDNRWIPGGVHWLVKTDRDDFSSSVIDLHYRPEEVEGFDLQRVGVFYAKPDRPLSDHTTWSWLPFVHDPDRRVFSVIRNHSDNPREEFNGYYAIIQADLLTYLGGVIPAVGVTPDNIDPNGPEVTPTGKTFWHSQEKKLYAVKDGELTIRWKNAQLEVVSEVRALNLWPEADTGVYQTYVSGTPEVPLGATADGSYAFEFSELQAADTDVTGVGGTSLSSFVQTFDAFAAVKTGTSPGRALIMLSTKPQPDQGDLFFQFIQVADWASPEAFAGAFPWAVGESIDASTDSNYAAFHNDLAGSPYVMFGNAPYAPKTTRYPGFYDRAARTGSIVPVNIKRDSDDDLVLAFYELGSRLIEARTGNPAKNPGTGEAVPAFAWPYKSAQYNLEWSTNVDSIVIARQDGSGELDVATYGTDLDVYVQNNPLLPGYNPNEEHALIAPYGGGNAVFALRDDLNIDDDIADADYTSAPYAMLAYYDPNDLLADGSPRAKVKPFQVKQTEGIYVFGPWAGVSGDDDPYEGSAGAFIQAPYPLSTFVYSPENTYTSASADYVFEDRTDRHWAKSATGTSNSIGMLFYYPPRADFFFPQNYRDKYGSNSNDERDFDAGDHVPFLDGGASVGGITPLPVEYQTTWPTDIATMNIGEILIEAKFGLPQINGQCSVDLIYMESGTASPSVTLVDPVITRSVDLAELPTDIATDFAGAELSFAELPPALNFRMSYDPLNGKLKFKGILVDPVTGFDYVLLNVLTEDDRLALLALSAGSGSGTGSDWETAVDDLAALASEPHVINDSSTDPYDVLALSSGDAKGTGYVTLAMQDSDNCDPLPVSLEIIRVVDDLNSGNTAVVKPPCVFDEQLTMTSTLDFAGHPENFEFEWLYQPDNGGTIPDPPDLTDPTDPWTTPPLNTPTSGVGVNSITISGPGLLTLTDNWFTMRYRHTGNVAPWGTRWSEWTRAQLGEGWIKRVVGVINPFNQRASGGGIAGAEESFASFGTERPNALVSMISQAGPRWTGSVPLNCNNLDDFGLIPIYATVLGRGADLSIDALSPVNNPGVNTALLLAASRLCDLYTLLGNEAYADAQDPTIAFGTDDGVYGSEATSIHAFMNQTTSLLDEELGLLRGRDDTFAPSIEVSPIHNRFIWNFTKGVAGGEVAYALNYNILDDVEDGNGVISEADAKRLYPQGHGDAWGHYLTALTTYYKLLRHPFYTWVPRSEALLVGGEPVTVDYMDERKFANVAAAKARAGAEIVNQTYRSAYVEDPAGQWQGYQDDDEDRAWGFSDWASRAGQAAYIDWAVGNAIIRAVDPDPTHTGLQKIDRTTVLDLNEVATAYDDIQAKSDTADLGLNPLGLGSNVVPFDISPTQIDAGLTHFEQIFERANTAMNNAATVFNHANNSTQLLRRQADSQLDFERAINDAELDYNARLIEIFGYPYSDDIGPGGLYETGYDGPDLFHYMYNEPSGIQLDGEIQDLFFDAEEEADTADTDIDAAQLALDESFEVGEGDMTFVMQAKNYGAVASCDFTPDPTDITGNIPTDCISLPSAGPLTDTPIYVSYNMNTAGGKLGIAKPSSWTGTRRAPGEIQVARSELLQAIGRFLSALDDYGSFVGDVTDRVELVEAQYDLSASQLKLLKDRLDKKKNAQEKILALTATKISLNAAADIVLAIGESLEKSVPTVTGIIVGFSNGVIIDGLSAVRGGISAGWKGAIAVLKAASELLDIGVLVVQQQGEVKDDELTIDTSKLEGQFANLQAINDLQSLLRNEVPLRIAMHNSHEAVLQAAGRYLQVLADGQRVIARREIFRHQVSADVQQQRYKDMAFRVFRNDALQKYRAQFDLASRYVYLTAKAYDYETTMLSSDPMAGEKFLTDIVRARQLGALTDGLPQTGVGLADSMAVMARNFEVLSGQLGFNNPQIETNRFSLRHELFRVPAGSDGDENWKETLRQDYGEHGIGTVDNLWDVPEFRQFCVPPIGFGTVEPGIVIPFVSTIEEGKNFFGLDASGLDNSYDSTQFATKIRSVGLWFSNYNVLGLSNTPRAYLIPAGTDILRSPTGFTGQLRAFNVLDQILPVPFPIGSNDLDNPFWIPSVDSLSGNLTAIRRFGRLRAYHDSGEFSESEVHRDSRLIGRSVWNTKWMLIIPASTLSSDRDEGLARFIDGALVNGERDGNGVSDIKLFFETYAFPRLKSAESPKGTE